MSRKPATLMVSMLLALSVSVMISPAPRHALASTSLDPATISVWNNACHSSNITISNPSCGSLAVGTSFSAELNITNVSPWNAFDLFLFYDQRFINATGFSSNQTVFTNAFTVLQNSQPGALHFAVTNLGSAVGNGTITHVFFKILRTGASSIALAAGSLTPSSFASSWTRIAFGSSPIDVNTKDGYFTNDRAHVGPIAKFTISPVAPTAGDTVTFDASASFDPDASTRPGIRYYAWDFGETGASGGSNATNAITTHVYSKLISGNFSVRLTIEDLDNNLTSITTQLLYVAPIQTHDISVALVASPTNVNPGDKVTVTVTITDTGTYDENFALLVYYQYPRVFIHQGNYTVSASGTKSITLAFPVNTTGLAPGAYTAFANAPLTSDPTPTDNSAQESFYINEPGTGTFYLVLIAAVIVFVVLVITLVTLRRRRKPDLGAE